MYFNKKQREQNQPLLTPKVETKKRQNPSTFSDDEASIDEAIDAFIRTAYIQFRKQAKTNQHGTD